MTQSARSARTSTSLPLPSSPHCAPTTTTVRRTESNIAGKVLYGCGHEFYHAASRTRIIGSVCLELRFVERPGRAFPSAHENNRFTGREQGVVLRRGLRHARQTDRENGAFSQRAPQVHLAAQRLHQLL